MKHRPHHRHKFLPRDSFVDDILSFLVSSPFFFRCVFIHSSSARAKSTKDFWRMRGLAVKA